MAGTIAACGGSTSTSPPETTPPVTTSAPVEASQIWSRRWIEEVESFVRSDKPGPPATARIYAYAAASCADAMSASDGGGPEANEVTRQVLRALLPKRAAEIDTFAATLAAPVTLAKPLQDLAAQYVARIPADGAAADNPDAAMATEPAGDGHWVRVGGAGPANPTAGTWMRWILPAGTRFTVPPPPEYGSKTYEEIVGTRYEVLADAAPLVPLDPHTIGWDGSDAPIYHGRITVFDLVTRQFFDILPFPNDHTYFQPVAVDDHTLEVLYAPEPSLNAVYGSVKWTRLTRRRVDLATFHYVDQEVALPHEFFESVNEAQNQSIDLGWTERPDYRTVRGHLVDAPGGRLSFVVDSTAPTYDNWVVDGVKITADQTNATNALTKVADGSPITTIHTDPGLLGVYGYRTGLLYLTMPIASAPLAGGVHPVGPAVLNPTSGVVAPLFDYSSPANVGVFVVGILPR